MASSCSSSWAPWFVVVLRMMISTAVVGPVQRQVEVVVRSEDTYRHKRKQQQEDSSEIKKNPSRGPTIEKKWHLARSGLFGEDETSCKPECGWMYLSVFLTPQRKFKIGREARQNMSSTQDVPVSILVRSPQSTPNDADSIYAVQRFDLNDLNCSCMRRSTSNNEAGKLQYPQFS